MSGVNLYNLIKLLYLVLSKALPLFWESLFKDRTFGEFVSENKLSVFLFLLIMFLSLILFSTRYKLYLTRAELDAVKVEVPAPPPPPPTEPYRNKDSIITDKKTVKKPVTTHDDTRDLIRERLGKQHD